MLGMLLSLFSGSMISSIFGSAFGALVQGYKAKIEAQSTTEARAVELAVKEIEGEVATRQAAAAVIRAEQGWWLTAMIRPMLAIPVIIYFWKCIVWDKVLGWGSTDPLDGMIGDWAGWVVVAYVGGRSIEKVARIFRR